MRHYKPHVYAEKQVPINEEWEARESAFDADGNLIDPQPGAYIQSFEAYKAPVCDDGDTHYTIRGKAEQSRIMHAHDAVDSRDVPKSLRNENVRKARSHDH